MALIVIESFYREIPPRRHDWQSGVKLCWVKYPKLILVSLVSEVEFLFLIKVRNEATEGFFFSHFIYS
jgi:hypothetical protein